MQKNINAQAALPARAIIIETAQHGHVEIVRMMLMKLVMIASHVEPSSLERIRENTSRNHRDNCPACGQTLKDPRINTFSELCRYL